MASTSNLEYNNELVHKERDEGDGERELVDEQSEKGEESEDEEIEWVVDDTNEDDDKASLILIGKIWTKKNVNAKALMETLKSLWNPRHRVTARQIDGTLFSFHFFHWRDKFRVLEGRPWHFDLHDLCFSEIDDDGKPYDFKLHSLPMWVRFYNLPFKGRGNDTNARTLASKIGTFMRIDKDDEIDISRSMRIRILVDVKAPLKDEIKIKLRGGTVKTILMRPHLLKKLGSWVRASPWKGRFVEEKKETKGCSRRLFVAKPDSKIGGNKEEAVGVDGVTEKLSGVEINKE
ncbi:hypothetical protein RDABS01_001421 [Bienertia sinuspersici]